MVVAVVGTEHADADVELQIEVAGDARGPAVADACGNEEFALVAALFPLKVVLAATGI